MKKNTALLFIIIFLGLFINLNATVRYVTQSGGQLPQNGSSWTNASSSIKNMINASSAGDEVWVAAGTYYTPSPYYYFRLKEGVKVYGGFPDPSPANPNPTMADRNWQLYQTILKKNTSVAVPVDYVVDNSFTGLVSAITLMDGCYIDGSNFANGGIRNSGGSVTYRNCKIYNCGSSDNGGGMYNDNSAVTLEKVEITNCEALNGSGGGMFSNNTSLEIYHSIIRNNSALSGGGITNINGNAVICKTMIQNNDAVQGGGIFNKWTEGSFDPSQYEMVLITDNEADQGGAIFNINCNLSINYATIAYNTDEGIRHIGNPGIMRLTNTIIYANGSGGTLLENVNNYLSSATYMTIRCCDIQGYSSSASIPNFTDLGGIVDVNPLFVSPTSQNYHLQGSSPVRDIACGNAPSLCGASDIDGQGEIGSGWAMGCYEKSTPVANNSLSFYPNPAAPKTNITITIDDELLTEGAALIQVYNFFGTKIMEHSTNSTNFAFIAPAQTGQYFVKAYSSNREMVRSGLLVVGN
ncbi:MAG: T9SS type A sorting domain-containing protein [Bacteroidales bacterium]|nr:T9SS type A sorting domain-containing protein [Bacteroidales bacterium]